MALNDQNGSPINPICNPHRYNAPETAGPRVRARHPKEAEAPLILAKWTVDGAVFVILQKSFSRFLHGFK